MALSKGTVSVSVLYPRTADSTFHLDYYITQHMVLAEKVWGPHGMINWSVIEAPNGDYSVHSFITFKAQGENGLDGVMAALTSEGGKELAADVPNFSNKTPQVVIGTVRASGSV
ncbi:hypothetical protein H2198_002402 [Neophaeococcomyces mojaviensis]|uniref:Uncharacterized protein n=1 Tax=Neophaeococcomyces mojaviensis TaxID=3383035 RepID=A0ACC3AEP0_9EURO|nr:hypothetical protein H2198_002402 [Knufia sp. JES_112]